MSIHRFFICGFLFSFGVHAAGNPLSKIQPGTTVVADLRGVLGPHKEFIPGYGASVSYYFYEPSAVLQEKLPTYTPMITVGVKQGKVLFYSYVCDADYSSIVKKAESGGIRKKINVEQPNLKVSLEQVVLADAGEGFVLDRAAKKVKACFVFEPGTAFEKMTL